ncbi:MAG: Branched-chain amino acid transport system permease protein LivM, partial [uncultured Nocardioidaceae bacterium]
EHRAAGGACRSRGSRDRRERQAGGLPLAPHLAQGAAVRARRAVLLRAAAARAADHHHARHRLRRRAVHRGDVRPGRTRAQHRRRLRRPARPRVRRLLRGGRLHDRGSRQGAREHPVPVDDPHRGARRDGLGDPAGSTDTARPRRLPGDRDARLRRDHPPHRGELGLAGRRARHQCRPGAAGRLPGGGGDPLRRAVLQRPAPQLGGRHAAARPRRDDRVPRLRCARPRAVLLVRAHGDHPRAVRGQADQGQPRRQGMGGDPRGRGRRRAHGRADVPVQAAGVRDGCLHRRALRSALRREAGLRQPAVVPPAALDPLRGGGRGRRAGQPVGRHGGRRARRVPARTVPRLRGVAGAGLRTGPHDPRDLPARGSLPAAPDRPGTPGRARDRGARGGGGRRDAGPGRPAGVPGQPRHRPWHRLRRTQWL